MSASQYLRQNSLQVVQDLVVPKPNDSIAFALNPVGSTGVVHPAFFESMLTAVKFHHQLLGFAKEVHNVVAEGHLAAELQALELAIAKCGPQPSFGLGLTSPKFAGTLD